jgi:hypothetical protein
MGEIIMRTLTGVIIVLGLAFSASNGLAQDEILLSEWDELPLRTWEKPVRIELCEGGPVKGQIDSLLVRTDGVALQVGDTQVPSSSISAVRLDEYKSRKGRAIGITGGAVGGFLLVGPYAISDSRRNVSDGQRTIEWAAGIAGGVVLGWFIGRKVDRKSTVFRKAGYCL